MALLQEKINHVVVVMLENRSFDSLLGELYPKSDQFDGLNGDESNLFNLVQFKVWTGEDNQDVMTIPNPNPGELFSDINEQLFENPEDPLPGTSPTMGGFVKNYYNYSQPVSPDEIMHHYLPNQVPILSTLAKNYAVCDAWFSSAPCQTWPNRFFVHTGTAGGYENNEPLHFPYLMPTIFTRFNQLGIENGWKIYYHDFPHSIVLSDLWPYANQFYHFYHFKEDALNGTLPAYSFIEPRYYTFFDYANDQHSPHDVRFGEELIADIYNTLQASPVWKNTLLIIIYDEHGGLYDHVAPPEAVPPEPPRENQRFAFDRYGVRIPAVIVSPYIAPGTVFRAPAGSQPFDHTSVISTLRNCFDLGEALTERDRSAPDLSSILTLSDEDLNLGTPLIPAIISRPPDLSEKSAKTKYEDLSDLQKSFRFAAAFLPDLSGAKDFVERKLKAQMASDSLMVSGPIGAPEHHTLSEVLPYLDDQLSKLVMDSGNLTQKD